MWLHDTTDITCGICWTKTPCPTSKKPRWFFLDGHAELLSRPAKSPQAARRSQESGLQRWSILLSKAFSLNWTTTWRSLSTCSLQVEGRNPWGTAGFYFTWWLSAFHPCINGHAVLPFKGMIWWYGDYGDLWSEWGWSLWPWVYRLPHESAIGDGLL